MLAIAHQWGVWYGRRPSELLLTDDPLAAALDLAAMGVGEEIAQAMLKKGAFPVVRVG